MECQALEVGKDIITFVVSKIQYVIYHYLHFVVRKRLRKNLNKLVQGHIAGKEQNWDLNPGIAIPRGRSSYC